MQGGVVLSSQLSWPRARRVFPGGIVQLQRTYTRYAKLNASIVQTHLEELILPNAQGLFFFSGPALVGIRCAKLTAAMDPGPLNKALIM